jgi:type VI secretion system secreted protein VgrG
MPILELSFACGESSLSVRNFAVHEAISSLFMVNVVARSESPSIDLEPIIGQTASLKVVSGWAYARLGGTRLWSGVVSSIEQVQGVQLGQQGKELSTYSMRIVPKFWLCTQRRNYKIFQHVSIPDIVDQLLGEWDIEHAWEIDRGRYPKLEYKVQYGETDFAFISRLFEEAGICFTFPDDDGKASRLVMSDKLESNPMRPGGPLSYVDNPNRESEKEYVTRVRLAHAVKPGAHVIRDYDFRNPNFALVGDAPKASGAEAKYEQYHYEPGASLVEGGKGGGTPSADDKGVARYDQSHTKDRASRLLGGARSDKRVVSFDANTIDICPGQIVSIDRHPHADIGEDKRLLVTEFSCEGSPGEEWSMTASATFADNPYKPTQKTQKPRVNGVQSATVVGPHRVKRFTRTSLAGYVCSSPGIAMAKTTKTVRVGCA